MRPKLSAGEKDREHQRNFMPWARVWIASSRLCGHFLANGALFLKPAVGMNLRGGNRGDRLRNIASAGHERTGSVAAGLCAAQQTRREISDRGRSRMLAARLRS